MSIQRRLLLYTFVAVLAIVFIQPPSVAKEPTEPLNKPEVLEVPEIKKLDTPKLEPTADLTASKAPASESKAKTTQKKTTPKPVPAGSCESAIAQVWPAELQSGAKLVAEKESSLRADSIGGVNQDGSQDFGCFQINNHAHPQFFANGDWSDPVYNAEYALKIYNGRGNWTAWYAVQGILW